MKRFPCSIPAAVVLGAVQSFYVSAALAQERSEDAPSQVGRLEEVVVTAQRRAQSLSDVGMSISASSGEQLINAGVSDIGDLNMVVPGFSAATTAFGYPIYSLRGINFNALQASAPPAVSTYRDEGSLPYPVMTGGLLLDVERVEVLKGPQGTLYGQNATGGSINIVTAKPTDHFSAGVGLEGDHFGKVMVDGHVSGPLSDTVQGRVALKTTQGGAWQKGYHGHSKKNGDEDSWAARVALDWQVTDRLDVAMSLNGFYDRGEIQQGQLAIADPVVPAGSPPGFIGYPPASENRDADFDRDFDTKADTESYQTIVRMDYALADELVFTSLTNYATTDAAVSLDLDGTAIPVIRGLTLSKIDTFSQEFRLTGSLDSHGLDYIIGVNYHKDWIDDDANNQYPGYSGMAPGTEMYYKYDLESESLGIFANIDYEIVPNLTLTAGARYTETEQTMEGCTYDGGNGLLAATSGSLAEIFRPGASAEYLPGGCATVDDVGGTYSPIVADEKQKDNNTSWRVGLNYKPTDDSLVYGLVSRGYKSGQFGVSLNLFQSAIQPVKQEELTAYEIGAKMSFLDRRLQLDTALFYYDYRDKQFFTYVPVGGIINVSSNVNIPKSSVKGAELGITAMPMEGLTVRTSLTYVDTEIDKFEGFDYAGGAQVASGKEFNFAPPLSATFDIEYRWPISSELTAAVGLNGLYNDRTFADLAEPEVFRIPSYAVFDARVGVESHSGWRASLWVRNLSDENYWTSAASGGDSVVRYSGRPRTFGITLGMDF